MADEFESAPSTGAISREEVTLEPAKGEAITIPTGGDEISTISAQHGIGKATSLLQDMHPSDAEASMLKEGYNPIEARDAIVEVSRPMIATALENNSEEELRYSLKNTYDYPDDLIDDMFVTPPKARDAWEVPGLVPVSDQNQVEEGDLEHMSVLARNVDELRMPFVRGMVSQYWTEDEEGQRKYAQHMTDLNYSVANTLRRLGRNVSVTDNGDLVETKQDGSTQVVDESILDSIAASEWEIIGAIGGGYGTVQAVSAATAVFGGPYKYLTKAAKGVGLVGGSAAGASVGRGLDILSNSLRVKKEVETAHIVQRMKDAGQMDGLATIIGTPLLYAGFGLVKGIGSAYDMIIAGNKKGAYQALKDTMQLDDSQVDEIIKNWENVTGTKAAGFTRARKALGVVPLTESGGEAIVVHSAGKSPKASSAIMHTINERAKNLNKATEELTNDNVALVLKDELEKYSTEVKDFYTGIKSFAEDSMADVKYSFDYNKLAIDPILEKMNKSLTNPDMRLRFANYMEKIRELGNVVKTPARTKTIKRKFAKDYEVEIPAVTSQGSNQLRSFSDLLELRKTVNEFKSFTKQFSHADSEAINSVMKRIDGEIASTASNKMPNGDVWLKEWKKANTEYSKMFTLQDNVMYKALTKKGVDVKAVVRALSNKISSIDGTFMQVLGKLPERTRSMAEGAVLDTLTKKHTTGFESGLQATHWPKLAAELKHLRFTTPASRELKRGISRMSEVFKNDYHLSKAVGQVNAPGFQHYLTTNPVARLKYEAANLGFDYVKRLAPTAQGRTVALVTNVAKVLENPVNSRAIKNLLKDLPPDSELSSAVRRLSIEYAKFGEKEHYPKVPVYRSGVPGSTYKPKDGKLGRGIYWTTNKNVARKRSRVTGGKVLEEKMLPGRIAVEQNIKDILGVEDFDMRMLKDNNQLVEMLKNNGYDGVSHMEEVLMFK